MEKDGKGLTSDHGNLNLGPGTEAFGRAEASDTSASSLASTYQVGKLEAGACANLLQHISPTVREALKELVRLGF